MRHDDAGLADHRQDEVPLVMKLHKNIHTGLAQSPQNWSGMAEAAL